MKKLLFVLLLAGCSGTDDFEVHTTQVTVTKYRCEHIMPSPHRNITVAMCDTEEQCNAVCEKARTDRASGQDPQR